MVTDYKITAEQASLLSRTDQQLLVRKEEQIYRFSRAQVIHQEVRLVRDDERRYRCVSSNGGPYVVADQVFQVQDLTPNSQTEWSGRSQLFFDLENNVCCEDTSFGLVFFGGESRERMHVGLKCLGFLSEHQKFEVQLLDRKEACYHGITSLLRLLESNPEPVNDLLDQLSSMLARLRKR